MMNIAYYLNSKNCNDNISLVKDYYISKNIQNNFFVTYDDSFEKYSMPNTASINFYYVRFMAGVIVFTSITDYLNNIGNFSASPVILLTENDLENIDRKSLQNFSEILLLKNNIIERINYEKI